VAGSSEAIVNWMEPNPPASGSISIAQTRMRSS
jgi:hypothetical protein